MGQVKEFVRAVNCEKMKKLENKAAKSLANVQIESEEIEPWSSRRIVTNWCNCKV